MCNPAVAVMAVGAVMSAASQVMQGQAAAQQATYQAQIARNNQIIAQRNADDARKRGSVAEDQLRERNAALLGRQRAELAGQGTEIDSGSPLDIQMDTAGLGEFDALTLRGGYERQAYGYEVQGMNYNARANLAETKTDTLGSWLAAGGSIIGGAAKAYGGLSFGGGGGGAPFADVGSLITARGLG